MANTNNKQTKIRILEAQQVLAPTNIDATEYLVNNSFSNGLAGWDNPSGLWGGTGGGEARLTMDTLGVVPPDATLSQTVQLPHGGYLVGFQPRWSQDTLWEITLNGETKRCRNNTQVPNSPVYLFFDDLKRADHTYTLTIKPIEYISGPLTHINIEAVYLRRYLRDPSQLYQWKYVPIGEVYPVDDVPLAINYQIADVQDFGKSQGNSTKTIDIVADDQAEQLFHHLSEPNTTFDEFDARYKFRMEVIQNDNIEYEGSARLLGATYKDLGYQKKQKVYQLQSVADAASFSELAEDFNLQSLDFSELDHEYGYPAISSSWSADYNSVYCYPTLYSERDDYYEVKDFKPAFFFMALFDKAMQRLGYSYTFSDEHLLSVMREAIIPYYGKKILLEDDVIEARSAEAIFSGSAPSHYYSYNPQNLPFGSGTVATNGLPTTVKYNTEIADPINQWNNAIPYSFFAANAGTYKVSFNLDLRLFTTRLQSGTYTNLIQQNQDQVYSTLKVEIRSSGLGLLSTHYYQNSPTNPYIFTTLPTNGNQGTWTVSGETTVDLLANDDVSIWIDHSQKHTYGDSIAFPSTYEGFAAEFIPTVDGSSWVKFDAQQTEVDEGATIELNRWLPDLTLGDLINYLRKKFNLYIYADPFDPFVIHFDTRNDYYNSGETEDWSGKLDNSSQTQLEYLPELVSERILFTDKQAQDEFNKDYSDVNEGEIYGQNEVNLNTNLSSGVKTIGPKAFSPTPILKNKFNLYCPAIDSRTPPSSPRVLLYKPDFYTPLPFRYFDPDYNGGQYIEFFIAYHQALHIDSTTAATFDLHYAEPKTTLINDSDIVYTQAGCYQRYWSEYIYQVENGKMLTGYFWLDPKDIQKIKKGLNNTIYLNGQDYIINRVVDYKPNRSVPTKVELLQVPTFHNHYLAGQVSGTTDPEGPSGIIQDNGTISGHSNRIVGQSTNLMVNGDQNIIGASTKNVLVSGDQVKVGGGLQNVVVIGNTTPKTAYQNGQIILGDHYQIADGELQQLHWFVGGLDESQTGIDPLMVTYPWVITGGDTDEVRTTGGEQDDILHWFIDGGDEDEIIPTPK